jgi:Flp pilus assembly protein TadB
MADRPGQWYEHFCKKVGGALLPLSHPEKRIAYLAERYEKSRDALRVAEDEIARLETQASRRTMEYHRLERKVARLKREADKWEKEYKGTTLKREIYFAGLDISPEEMRMTSLFVMILSFVLMIALFIWLLFTTYLFSPQAAGTIVGDAAYLSILGVIFVPLILYLYFVNYPLWLANRLRIQTLGRAPEAVHYMVMSMRLTPSLDRAVRFASENVDDPLSSSLKKVLWDVSTRTHATIEESFMAFAEEWGNWNEDFKRSMYSIRMATHEKTEEGLSRNLEKALDAILSGTRRKIEEFASSLQSPTTVLFGLGILLPMIIGAMLPLLMLANAGNLISNPLGSSGNGASTTNPLGASALSPTAQIAINVGLIVMMDILFPLIAYVYSAQILGKRPGTLKPPKAPATEGYSFSFLLGIGILVGALISLLAIPAGFGLFGNIFQDLFELFPILGIAAGASLYFYMSTIEPVRARKALQRLEAEFPDALYQVGSRMAEGLSLEHALERTADAMAGSETSALFRRILHGMRVSGRSAEEVIFGSDQTPGVIALYPSHMIESSMRALLEAVTKGSEAVGRTIVPMAQYLRELRQVDDTIRTSLKGTVSMMTGTAIAFAPLVMGMTGALYILLTTVLASGQLPVSVPVFFTVLGVYLLEIVLVINYFAVGVESGGDETAMQSNLGVFLVVSAAVFFMAAVMGLYLIAGVG